MNTHRTVSARLPASPESKAKYLRDPSNWIMAAQLQLRAARLLSDKVNARIGGEGQTPRPGEGSTVDAMVIVDMDLFRPMYMLGGLALELVFKAAIVLNEPNAISDNGKGDWQNTGDGHRLTSLATRSGVPGLDTNLLATLEPFVSEKGRYPVDPETFYGDGALENFAGSHTAGIMDQIEKMYKSARQHIREHNAA